MKKEKNWLFLTLSLLAILAGLCFSSPQVLADGPKGIMKGAVHFGIAGI